MAKFVGDNVLDAMLEYTADRGDQMSICAGQPLTFTDANDLVANGGNALARHTLTPITGGGDFTIVDGDTNGRKLVVAEQTSISIEETGTADHISIQDTTESELLLVTTLASSQAVTSGNTATVSTFDDEVADPT